MKNSFKNTVGERLAGLIAEFLGIDTKKVSFSPFKSGYAYDFLLKAGGYKFLVEYKNSTSKASINMMLSQMRNQIQDHQKGADPLMVVPYMSQSGREMCEKAEVSWLDLSGNAHIQAEGLLIRIEGKPDLFRKAGRPPNVFAPKSSRIARQLITHPEKSYTQRQLSQATGLDEGFTSRLVRRLEKDGLVVRNKAGALRARDPDILLDSWREVYHFGNHYILRGHIPARSGEELLHRITDVLNRGRIKYAATGLAASWLLTRFTGFRISTIFLHKPPNEDLLKKLGFRKEERGSNTWLVVPDDESVFWGATRQESIWCVHPVQIYLDLKGHPERAAEAAGKVREEYLIWKGE